jgi:hypothetical protein
VDNGWSLGFVTFVKRYQHNFDPGCDPATRAEKPVTFRPFLRRPLFTDEEQFDMSLSMFRTQNYIRVLPCSARTRCRSLFSALLPSQGT